MGPRGTWSKRIAIQLILVPFNVAQLSQLSCTVKTPKKQGFGQTIPTVLILRYVGLFLIKSMVSQDFWP